MWQPRSVPWTSLQVAAAALILATSSSPAQPVDLPVGVASEELKGTTPDQPVYSSNLVEVDFSVDIDFGPVGLAGSGVLLEQTPPMQVAEDDFYLAPPWGSNVKTFDENVPPPGGPIVPALNFGTGHGENTDALCFGTNNYLLPNGWTIEDGTLELFQAVTAGLVFLQFTVNPDSVGLVPSDVNTEASQMPSEEGGDVFESLPPGGSNRLIADEQAIGLEDSPEDDANALVIPDTHLMDPSGIMGMTPPFGMLPITVDTNGPLPPALPTPDAPMVYFSLKSGGLFGPFGADVYRTATYTGGPTLNLAWSGVSLGLNQFGPDELDALYVENPNGMFPLVYYSLARGSASLRTSPGPIRNPFNLTGFGADPGDVIGVVLNGAAGVPGAAAIVGPVVVIPAGLLGLVGDLNPVQDATDDDLNGLHLTLVRIGEDPPTPTPTATATSTPTSTSTPTETNTQPWTPTPTRTEHAPIDTPTPTWTPTWTPTDKATPTDTPDGTPTATPSRTRTFTPTPSGTGPVGPTATPSPTRTLTSQASATRTPTPDRTPTPTPTQTGPLPTPTPSRTGTLASPTPTLTGGAGGDTPTPSATPFPAVTETPTGSVTPAATATPTLTGGTPGTETPTRTPEGNETPTETATPAETCTNSRDLNGDGTVDARDLLEMCCQCRGEAPSPGYSSADFDCDESITAMDVLLFHLGWMEE